MNQTEKNIAAIEFTLLEIKRLQDKFKSTPPKTKAEGLEYLYHIPLSSGGMLPIGEEANKKLYAIAERSIENDKTITNIAEPSSLLKELKLEIRRVFLKNYNEVNESNVAKVISRAIKTLKNKHKPITYYIPCVLFDNIDVGSFEIGDIIFYSSNIFKEKYQAEIIEDIQSKEEPSGDIGILGQVIPKLKEKPVEVKKNGKEKNSTKLIKV